jgi:hypothetical protein
VHTLAARTSHSCTHTLTLAHCAPRHISDSLALLWRTTKLDHSPTTSVGNVAIKSIARRCERQATPHYCAQRPCFALHLSSVMLPAQPVNLLEQQLFFLRVQCLCSTPVSPSSFCRLLTTTTTRLCFRCIVPAADALAVRRVLAEVWTDCLFVDGVRTATSAAIRQAVDALNGDEVVGGSAPHAALRPHVTDLV